MNITITTAVMHIHIPTCICHLIYKTNISLYVATTINRSSSRNHLLKLLSECLELPTGPMNAKIIIFILVSLQDHDLQGVLVGLHEDI